jgi:hypothetical protein
MSDEDKKYFDEYAKQREEAVRLTNMMFGGIGASFAPDVIKYFDDGDYYGESFKDRVRRADFISDNWEDNLYSNDESGQSFGFKRSDPRLRKAFINRGVLGVSYAAPEVFADSVGKTTEFAPADISGAGAFRPDQGQQTILTVTPEPDSQRFASPEASGAGGGASATLWGNDREPQYSYARGNYGVERVISANPSAHFSAAELPSSSRQRYMTTGVANEAGAGNQGWGRSHGNDLHFSKDFRKAGGLTTANDIVTYLRQRGEEVPALVENDGPGNLERLTKKLSKVTRKPDYKALQSIASPQPTWGAPTRELGQLPVTTGLSFKEGIRQRAGVGTFFELEKPNPDLSFSPQYVATDLPSDATARIRKGLIDVDNLSYVSPPSNRSRTFAGSRLSGLVGTSLISPDAAKDFKDGKPVHAVTKLVLGGGLGELTGMGANKMIHEATKRGMAFAPSIARGLGRALSPVVAIDAMDTASILATGKNPRELAVETGNEAPHVAASMAPLTGAPLGFAGNPFVQGNVSGKPTLYLRTESEIQKAIAEGLVSAEDSRVRISRKNIADNKAKREAAQKARQRGGRFRVGPFTLPEYGVSEFLGFNK